MNTDLFPTASPAEIEHNYRHAQDAYARLGVDTDAAIARALQIPISLHCWQGDDVGGFEVKEGAVDSGGIMATGNFPGRARNGDELRQDLEQVMKLLPGVQRVNIHAFYAETSGRVVSRDALEPKHFSRWMDWAKALRIGLDFNPTFFAHPKAADGFTLSHRDPTIRQFWVRHGIACRHIASAMAATLGQPCVINHWIPDGAKDHPADRWSPRARLTQSLDEMLRDKLPGCVDAVESKLFGIGSEDYVVGSFEYYSHYALTRDVIFCLDMGHFHPTETIHDKLSALLQFHKKLLLHVSRPIRWDSDHVVIFNDDLRAVFLELARGDAFDRAIVALDFFDASINRIAAYVIGARATRQAMLYALLDPSAGLRDLEATGRNAEKLARMEAMKLMPFGAVWDMLCLKSNVPPAAAWIRDVESYRTTTLSRRP